MVKTTTDTAKDIAPVQIIPNWHTTDNKFTGDEMIDAYFLGRKAGIQAGWDEKFKILAAQFSKNLESAVALSEEFYEEVLAIGISLKAIHLKAEGLTKFTSLFVSEVKDYASEDFLKVHSIARKYKGAKKNEDIYISFLFMPQSEKISNDCLTSEGYFLQYDKNK